MTLYEIKVVQKEKMSKYGFCRDYEIDMRMWKGNLNAREIRS